MSQRHMYCCHWRFLNDENALNVANVNYPLSSSKHILTTAIQSILSAIIYSIANEICTWYSINILYVCMYRHINLHMHVYMYIKTIVYTYICNIYVILYITHIYSLVYTYIYVYI
jgi:hypothetical protein